MSNQAIAEAIIAELAKLPIARHNETDGEESDGTPRYWRDRPFISLRKAERIIREALAGSTRAPRVAEPKPDFCPHAHPFVYCETCVANPCPLGLGDKK